MAKPTLEISYDSPKTHQKGPEMGQWNMQWKVPLKGLEEDCSTHAWGTQNMAKRAPDRAKADVDVPERIREG